MVIIPEDFVLKIPASLPIEKAAPILGAGVTTFSPLRHWKVKAGDKVGILGFGGLGDMAAKLAKAMGAEVVIFTTTEEKIKEAAGLGATGVYAKDEEAVAKHKLSFDFILSTIPEKSDLSPSCRRSNEMDHWSLSALSKSWNPLTTWTWLGTGIR